jgi:ABC-type sugar transport system permease subunit
MTGIASDDLSGRARKVWENRVGPFIDEWFFYLLIIPSFIALLIVYYIPLARIIQLSFNTKTLINPALEFVGLGNFRRALQSDLFALSLRNTVIWTVAGVTFQFLLGLGTALLANRQFKGRKIFRSAMLIPYITPTVVAAIVWRWMYNPEFGVINEILLDLGWHGYGWLSSESLALWGVIFVNTWKGFPFFFVTLLAGLQSIPKSYYEAAKVDGANAFQQFWHITLPQLRPMINIAVVLATVSTFNYLGLVWALTRGGPANATEILPVMVYRQAFVDYSFGYSAAIALVIFAVNLVFVISYVRILTGEQGEL